MTTPQIDPQVLNYCESCQLDYYAGHCAPCPLCPLAERLDNALLKVRMTEPCRIIESANFHEMQGHINEMEASGWVKESFHVGHKQTRDEGWPVYVAVFLRKHYDEDAHQDAVIEEKKAGGAHRARRIEIDLDTGRIRANRNGDGCSC